MQKLTNVPDILDYLGEKGFENPDYSTCWEKWYSDYSRYYADYSSALPSHTPSEALEEGIEEGINPFQKWAERWKGRGYLFFLSIMLGIFISIELFYYMFLRMLNNGY